MEHIRVDVAQGIGTLTIDRRERFNSLDVATAQGLRKAGLLLSRDPAVRVVVLRGTGGIFCSGADLKYIHAGGASSELNYLCPGARPVPTGSGEVFKQILEYLHATISEIRRSTRIWIAAVDGVAAAGGLGLAMACDLVFASERSTFEWAYGKTALTGAESSTFILPRLIGLRRAMGMAFLNPRLSAADALGLGLINQIVPSQEFEPAIASLAQRVARGPVDAYAVTKSLFNQSAGLDRLDQHLDRELEELVRSADSPEFAEGVDAFFQKRAPDFGGWRA